MIENKGKEMLGEELFEKDGEWYYVIKYTAVVDDEEIRKRGLDNIGLFEQQMELKDQHELSVKVYIEKKHYECDDCSFSFKWSNYDYDTLISTDTPEDLVNEDLCNEHELVDIEIE